MDRTGDAGDDGDMDEVAYVDVPASSVRSLCPRCDGDGWVYVPHAAVIGGRMVPVSKPEFCSLCRSPAEGQPPSGRINFGTGPGAQLRPWERARGPWDDWPSLP